MNNFFQIYSPFSILPNTYLAPQINYYQVFQQFQSQINLQNKQISHLKQENLHLKTQIQHYKFHRQQQKQLSEKTLSSKQPKSKIKIEKHERNFLCDYENCDRSYSSTLALNLHIKNKHNGGTKKQRDAYAKLIVMAELRGEPRPEINFTFSENYLKRFKQRLLSQHNVQNKDNDQIQKCQS